MNDALLKAALRLLDAAKGDHNEMTQTTDGHYEFELDLAISGFEKALAQQAQTVREPICRTDGRCQYAIDHGAEGLGHCPAGKCVMPEGEEQGEPNEGNG